MQPSQDAYNSLNQAIEAVNSDLHSIAIPKQTIATDIDKLIQQIVSFQGRDEEKIKTQLSELASTLIDKGHDEQAEKIMNLFPVLELETRVHAQDIPNQPDVILSKVSAYFSRDDLKKTSHLSKKFLEVSDQAKVNWINDGKPIRDLNMDDNQLFFFFLRNGKNIKHLEFGKKLPRDRLIKDPMRLIKCCPNLNYLSLRE